MQSNHAENAAAFLKDEVRAKWHDQALWHVRARRDAAVRSVPDWEQLRNHAEKIKKFTLATLAEQLTRFETNAVAAGACVHWAQSGADLSQIVGSLLRESAAHHIVKSKSMLTEECGLNHYLEKHGFAVTDTDLGEWIVQLRKEAPSHIVLPAIHIRKEEVGTLLTETIGTPANTVDPALLTRAACNALREKYKNIDAAISGANFIIAESGAVVICTNEGNADLGITLAPMHIVCVGLEKLLPNTEDLGVFLRLLARSATGQAITTYTSHLIGPQPGQKLHIILVDNGRSRQLADPELCSALACIRCGACLNTCPVYRRSGGASYGWTIPGPIGSVLAPQRFPEQFASLPFASSLCGSCTNVCPVKIPLHEQLLLLRERLTASGQVAATKTLALGIGAKVMHSRFLYEFSGKCTRRILRILPSRWLISRWNPWTKHRDVPIAPKESFRDWYRRTRGRR